VKIVVDTNIVFSAILNSASRIALILISGKRHFSFYSCEFLLEELDLHRDKLRGLTKLQDAELDEVIGMVTKNITFINEAAIPASLYKTTELQMKGNDLKDVPFVALAQGLDAKLWTGDKFLSKGLAKSHPNLVVSATELFRRINELET
jgi:predicted nucleic acid-binding protein